MVCELSTGQVDSYGRVQVTSILILNVLQTVEKYKNYCFKKPVCVKCANCHLTKDCTIKEKTKEVICANCSGNHSASYKGCYTRKQLQQKLFSTLREKTLTSQNGNNTSIPTINVNSNSVNPNVSFAQAVKSQGTSVEHETLRNQQTELLTDQTVHNNEGNGNNNNRLENMIEQLMKRMDTMLNL